MKMVKSELGMELVEADKPRLRYDRHEKSWICGDGRTHTWGNSMRWAYFRYLWKKELYDLTEQIREETHEIMIQRFWAKF